MKLEKRSEKMQTFLDGLFQVACAVFAIFAGYMVYLIVWARQGG
jgi:hypothetical protein